MKLYTLDYDCNMPTVQQVNVATNTDAKIGIKVKQNGEYIALDGNTLSIETPEIIVPEPEVVNGTSQKVTKSQLPFPVGYIMYCPLSSVAGGEVLAGASNLKVEISEDSESWSDYTWTATLMIDYLDTAIHPTAVIARCVVSNGETKWTWKYGEDTGKTFDTVPATATSQLRLAFNDTDVSAAIVDGPRYFRLDCKVQGASYHATIPADEELTNGYVTFPISTLDNAGYAQNTVIVNKPEVPVKAQFKLNLNTFKSQQGDKNYAEPLPEIPTKTVTFAGTYADETSFSFDLYYKD